MGEIKRVIKFRVWEASALGSAMTYIDDMYWFEEQQVHSIEDDGIYKFMQFTSLLDKNGKEIYEGDIVRYTYNRDTKTTTSFTEVIEYDKWADVIGVRVIVGMNPEIIGNIYEHPHLLNPTP